MSTQIIASLRHQKQLRGNTFLIATELAHRMNSAGYGRVAYQFLAWKAHCCRRTAITQMAKLIALNLYRKTVIRTKSGNAWNLYQYIGPRVHTASPPGTTRGATLARTLPEDKQTQGCLRREERDKEESLHQQLANQRKGIRFLTPGSERWQVVQEEIARLEAVLAPVA